MNWAEHFRVLNRLTGNWMFRLNSREGYILVILDYDWDSWKVTDPDGRVEGFKSDLTLRYALTNFSDLEIVEARK